MTGGAAPTFRLDVLGAGPAYTDRAGALGASYLVRTGTTSLVLDLGQGAFTPLAGALDPADLDAVLVSHLHPDHFVDLVALRHYLRWEFQPPRRVRVIGPAGLAGRIDGLHAEPGFAAATLDVEPVEAVVTEERRIGDLAVSAAKVTHTADSHAYRVGRAEAPDAPGLVYSGDCARAEDLDVLVRPGDTLLCEVSYGPGPVAAGAMHLDGPAVGRLAARTGVGRILLTHLQMRHDEAATVDSVRAHADVPTRLVRPGDAIDLTVTS